MKVLLLSKDINLIFSLDANYSVELLKSENRLYEKLAENNSQIAIIDYDLIQDPAFLLKSLNSIIMETKIIIIFNSIPDISDQFLKIIHTFILKPYSPTQILLRLKLLEKTITQKERRIEQIESVIFIEIERELNKIKIHKDTDTSKLEWNLYLLRLIYDDAIKLNEIIFFSLINLTRKILISHKAEVKILIDKRLNYDSFSLRQKREICLISMCFIRAFSVGNATIRIIQEESKIIFQNDEINFINRNTLGNLFFSLVQKYAKMKVNVSQSQSSFEYLLF